MMPRAYSWQCTWELLLVVLKVYMECWGFQLVCHMKGKHSTLPAVLYITRAPGFGFLWGGIPGGVQESPLVGLEGSYKSAAVQGKHPLSAVLLFWPPYLEFNMLIQSGAIVI